MNEPEAPAIFFSPLSFVIFGIAWSTKLATGLAVVPIFLGVYTKRFPARTLWLFFSSLALGYSISSELGYPGLFHGTQNSNLRICFLDGLIVTKTPTLYFLQAALCKLSLAGLILVSWAAFSAVQRKIASGLLAIALLLGALVGCSFLMPGLGVRIVFILLVTALFLSCFQLLQKEHALGLIALLAIEGVVNRNALIAYQNPFAGNEPRLLDSNTDWGQGLKQLAHWRKSHEEAPLALSLFGGTLPETYGISEYFALTSFPELPRSHSKVKGKFSGYVAVSRNFLAGYPFWDKDLIFLSKVPAETCFAGALCLYDLRETRR